VVAHARGGGDDGRFSEFAPQTAEVTVTVVVNGSAFSSHAFSEFLGGQERRAGAQEGLQDRELLDRQA